MSEPTGNRRASTAVWFFRLGWVAVLAWGVWFLRDSLPAAALLVAGVVVLAVGATGIAAPLVRRRPGDHVAGGWVLCAVAGLVLIGGGVVLLVTG
ncbi:MULTISPECIES: hypothetical protein [unclassified Saccharothrix]|uniref:hypothetical protein n=1 Tax=unclassified Saccharothrix TaxID=2593673 RepID=UPI00307ED875